jgi:hypothetical protein
MTNALLILFLADDYTPDGGTRLASALAKFENNEAPAVQHLTFNRFEFMFDAENGIIVIDDVLDASETGTRRVRPEELKAALGIGTAPTGAVGRGPAK